ncbi:MAG TPA: cytochrome c3 family protein [Acidobacteriota bacterium]|nr:cytochrome c3 family protein [Acidobacteriota bacterium]
MAQIFHRSTNTIARVTIFGGIFILALLSWVWAELYRSDYSTEVNVVRDQPVPFSHKHHVSDDGIDCRYCHTTVETSKFAGIPGTDTCMTCHSEIWADSPMLQPVRDSYQTGKSIEWARVHVLPDYVFFDHSIHVSKGIGCSTCHGRVDQMPLTWSVNTLFMGWCLDCHRTPALFVRPRDQVFNMSWVPPADQPIQGEKLVKEYKIKSQTDCWTCHR